MGGRRFVSINAPIAPNQSSKTTNCATATEKYVEVFVEALKEKRLLSRSPVRQGSQLDSLTCASLGASTEPGRSFDDILTQIMCSSIQIGHNGCKAVFHNPVPTAVTDRTRERS